MKQKQKHKHFLAAALAGLGLIATVLAVNHAVVSASVFKDVFNQHENSDAITYVKGQGIVIGYEDGTYRPDITINRAEFTKIIVEAVWPGEAVGSECFSDVKDEWFAKYVCFAKFKNVISGYPDGTFKPAQSISFVEAAKIIVNAFGFAYSVDEIWYKPYVEILGVEDAIPVTIDRFSKEITRGEMAEMIYRLKADIGPKVSFDFEALSQLDLMMNQPLAPSALDAIRADFINLAEDLFEKNMAEVDEDINVDVSSEDKNLGIGARSPFAGIPCKSDPSIVFEKQFVDPSKVAVIIPSGAIISQGMGVYSDVRVNASDKVPVYAPHDAELVIAGYYSSEELDGYNLSFQVSCEIAFKFTLTELSPVFVDSIKAENLSNSISDAILKKSVPVKAGDLVGYFLPGQKLSALGFAVFDSTRQNTFVNPDRYAYGWPNLYSQCPYDFFRDDLRKEYQAKFGMDDGGLGRLVPDAVCQGASQDVAGTIAGTWFERADYTDNEKSLAVAVGADGTSVRVIGNPFVEFATVFQGDVTFKLPSEVKTEHCYVSRYGGVAYLKLISDMEMEAYLDKAATSCPASFPTTGTVKYYR